MTREIFRCLAGSRLFGTANADSDHDYKAVHLPSRKDILLGSADKVFTSSTGNSATSNGADDVDMTSHPLQKYLHNLAKMETNAIEMLFAPNMVPSGAWDYVFQNRERILNANKKSFTGFAKSQAMRYAVRGERLEALEDIVMLLSFMPEDVRICDHPVGMKELRQHKGVSLVEKPQPAGPGGVTQNILFISVQGREVATTVRPREAMEIYMKPLRDAGKRSKAARENGNVDWKGLYHAQRVVDEGYELFTTGELRFPLQNAPYYQRIRNAEHSLDEVLNAFEMSLMALEDVDTSGFRQEPDWAWIDDCVMHYHGVIAA